MSIVMYNTLTRKKEPFEPINPPKVGMYVCGVTVYDYSHIGHARSTIIFDVIVRYLRHKGFDVTYVRNFTDIDDKIINRSNELGIKTSELTDKFIAAFNEDMAALGLRTPDIEPKCTTYVPQMISFIEDLVSKESAYPTPSGDVYYRVHKFPGYGKLSGKNIEDLEAGKRVDVGEEKESPGDFALWKAAKPGEPKWESPWGEGRPGWHIECSVMSMQNIGQTLDIHGGGKDLIFPHHENEIAQSEAHNGQPYAKYWLHNGFVNVPSDDDPEGTKMSKSLGNFFTIRDVLAAFHPQTIKFFMLSTHYRHDVLFTEEGLRNAQARLAYFYETLAGADAFIAANDPTSGKVIDSDSIDAMLTQFTTAMDDDFNTVRAFGDLSGIFKRINELTTSKDQAANDIAATLQAVREKLGVISGVLGVMDLDPAEFEKQLKDLQSDQAGITAEEIEALLAERRQARADKNWARADEIRDELADKGVVIKDSKDGTTWTMKS